MTAPIPRRFHALLVLALAHGATGCCCGGEDYLTLGVSSHGGAGTTTPLWGETMQMPEPWLVASFPEDRELGGPAFEVFDAELTPLMIPSMQQVIDNDTRGGCGTSVDVTYDLSEIDPGTVTVVHRRKNGTGDRVNCLGECPWTTFDGDEALVLSLVIPAP